MKDAMDHKALDMPIGNQVPLNASADGQRGASLIMVMLILIIVSILGVGGAQIALMSERGARNDRDMQIAWQASEVALLDAEADMFDLTPNTTRNALFNGSNSTPFTPGCGAAGSASAGLCGMVSSGKPAWLQVDFADTSANAKTVAAGTYTGRALATGGVGLQPAQAPRYMIELVPDQRVAGDKSEKTSEFMYLVTAMGFGPRSDIQAVTQILYRK